MDWEKSQPHFLLYINSELETDLDNDAIDFITYCLLNDLATLTEEETLWIVTDGVNKIASKIVDKITGFLSVIKLNVIGVTEWKEDYDIYFDSHDKKVKPKYLLRRNHTHFVFYDDFGLDRKTTGFFKFIEEIQKNIQVNKIFGFAMPPVQIFIKGALKTIHSALIKNHIVVAVRRSGENETDYICNELDILTKRPDKPDKRYEFARQICKEFSKKIFLINIEEQTKNFDELIKIASLRFMKSNFITPVTSAASFLRNRSINETGIIQRQQFSKEHQLHDPKFLVLNSPIDRSFLQENLEPWNVNHCAVTVCLNCGLDELDAVHKDRIYSVIRSGLFNVPTEFRVCIVTDGVNPTVGYLINKAVHEQKTRISEKRELTIIGIIAKETITDTTILQANHTHFILSQATKDCASIKEIIAIEVLKNESVGIPAIQVFMGGDISILQTMCDAKKLYGHIILLMNGSGGVTDMVCKSIDQLSMEWDDEDEVKAESLLRTFIGNKKNLKKNIEKYIYLLKDFVSSNRDNIMIIDYMNSSKTLYDVVISGMFYYEERSIENLIILAMAINELNLAKQFISRNNPAITLNFDNLITKALINDQADFVKLFIEHDDFSVNHYIRLHLSTLYEEVEDELLIKIKNVKNDLPGIVAKLTNDINPPVYYEPFSKAAMTDKVSTVSPISPPWYRQFTKLKSKSSDFMSADAAYLENALQDEILVTKSPLRRKKSCLARNGSLRSQPDRNYDSANNDLLFWAILSHRFKIVQMLWLEGKHHMSTALIISIIMNNLANKAKEQIKFDLADDFSKEAKEYESFALYLLNEAQTIDKVGTELILLNSLSKWNGNSCLKLAMSFGTQKFIAHTMCERLITNQWNGSIPVRFSTVQLWLNIFLFPILNGIRLLLPKCLLKSANKVCLSLNQIHSFKPMVYATSSEDSKVYHKSVLSLNGSYQKSIEISQPRSCCFCAYLNDLRRFYTAPVTIFWTNAFSHVAFLLIFSYFALFKINESRLAHIHWSEIFIWTWFFGFALQEVFQIKQTKWDKYFQSSLNKYDLTLIGIMFLCVLLRLLLQHNHTDIARLFYFLLLGMMFIRTLQFYFVHPTLGPKVYMIQQMVQDVFFFLGIFLIFILSYGILRQALLIPSGGDVSYSNFINILYYPYWQTYGELFLEDMKKDEVCLAGGYYCEIRLVITWVIFAVFMLVTNIILVNLLIAMFGITFENVQAESEKIHLLYRVNLLQEFSRKSPFPPPVNICQIYRLFQSKSQKNNIFVEQVQGMESHLKIKILEDRIMNHLKENRDNLEVILDSDNDSDDEPAACTKSEMQSALDELSLRIENNFESILSSKQEIVDHRLDDIEKALKKLIGK